MRPQANLFALLLLVCGGCSQKKQDYKAQCDTTVTALGVGFENVDTIPVNESEWKAQLAVITQADDLWNRTKEAVTASDLRKPADALAVVVHERKTLLATASLTSAATSRKALEDNRSAYHARFQPMLDVCIDKGR